MVERGLLDLLAGTAARICDADDGDELFAAVQRAITRLGFDTFNLSAYKPSKHHFMLDPTLTSWTDGDFGRYDDEDWYERDPLLAHAVTSGGPLLWSADSWQGSTMFAQYGEYLGSLGLKWGVTAPLSQRNGAISAITALSFGDACFTKETATAVYIIGETALIRASALGLAEARAPQIEAMQSLSALQMEILHWVRHGKSNSEIAQIINRSHRMIVYHLSEILRKLGVASRAQAAAIYSTHSG